MSFGEYALIMEALGRMETREQILRLCEYLRWNDTSIEILSEQA